MELRTYTGLWNVEKRLYKFYDIDLPYPVSLKQLGLLIGTGVPWVLLMTILHIPFAPPFGHLLWIAPPALLTWWANKPVAEGKKLFDYVTAQASFWLRPKSYAALEPVPDIPDTHRVTAMTWRRHNLDEEAIRAEQPYIHEPEPSVPTESASPGAGRRPFGRR